MHSRLGASFWLEGRKQKESSEFLNILEYEHCPIWHSNSVVSALLLVLSSLISHALDGDPEKLMKNPSTPQRFWLPLLYDSLKLLNWQDCPLLSVSQTNLLLNKLQELSLARLRPLYTEPNLPSDALSSIRLALATNLGRAILDE